jgi:hypothetical protein
VVMMVLYWCFYMITRHVMNMQALILQGEWTNVAILSICFQSLGFRDRSIWSFERQCGFVDRFLLGSFTEKMFKERTRVSHATFRFLCEKLGPFLKKQHTHLRKPISVEARVAMSLARLGTGDGLRMVGEVYGVAECTISGIVREFCKMVRLHLQKIFIQIPNENRLRVLAKEFEKLHNIPYIIGAIDGSHIPVLAPVIGGEDYYCRKSFHSALLQGIVDTNCIFWDYEFGWAGSLHDWTVFQQTKVGRACMEGKFQPYKLIGDAAYPVRPWMYCPFKGTSDGLELYKAHWNFIQSSTRMCVERAFGILKGRWRIIQKRADVPLRSMADIVSTCIVLHNLCIITKDKFDAIWIDEAEVELKKRVEGGTMKGGQVLRGQQASIDEVKSRIYKSDRRRITRNFEIEEVDDEEEAFLIKQDEKDENLLKEATLAHESIAKTLWEYNLAKESTIQFSESSSDAESMEE